MAIGNSENGNVQVEITKRGVTITLRDKFAWKIEQSWNEISSIQIDTTEENLVPSESGESNLPIIIKSGEIKIGDGGETDTGLAQNEEQGREDEQGKREGTEWLAEVPHYWKSIQEETGIQYDSATGEVEFPENKQLSDVFSDFIRFLFRNRYMSKSDLPWTTPNARTNYVLNSQPVHKDGEEMDAVEVIDGVFFDRKIPRVQRERHVKRLVEEFVKE